MKKEQLSNFTLQKVNSNRHKPRGMGLLDNSIAKDGWIGSITVTADNETFDGSARLETAYGRFGEDVEPIIVDADGTRPIIVRRTDIPNADDPRAKRLSVAANRVAEVNLDYDLEVLAELHEEVDLSEMFFADEIAALMEKEQSEIPHETKEENEDELNEALDNVGKVESRVKLGEIWALGRHRICCGDSTVESNVKALLGDRIASLIHADPPYGMGKEKDGVLNDNLYRDKLDDFQMKWWRACRGDVADNASAYIWGNAEDLWRLWYKGGLKDSERLTFRNQIIWYKDPSGLGDGQNNSIMRSYGIRTEHCLFYMLGEQGFNNNADNYWEGWENIRVYLKTELQKVGDIKWAKRTAGHSEKSGCHWFDASQWTMPTEEVYKAWQGAAKGDAFKREYDDLKREYDDLKREWYETRAYFNNTHENMTDVWEYPRVHGEERWGHATPKPVDMIARIYKSSSPDDGVIYSPFLGSGTDIIAGEKLEGDRTVYGFELSEDYCEVIIQRYENFTGDIAKLVGRLPN
jgi:DNA modification methylase